MSDANGFYLQRLIEERDELKRERDHYKALASPTAREGWKLVPRNPTREMLQAFIDNAPMHNLATIKRLERQGGSSTLSDAQLADVWRAGYDAAPPSPDGGGR